MASSKEQTPRQHLTDEGSAVPSEVQPTEGSAELQTRQEHSMAQRKTRKAEASSHADAIAYALEAATEVVNDDQVDELDWLVLLKAKVQNTDTPFTEQDLRRYLRQAKLNRDGRKDFLRPGDNLSVREDEWLWRGVVMRQATNLVFALPKVGKTRLMLALLSHFIRGRGEFAGIPLHPGPEKLLILGPDQSENSWSRYLRDVGLGDEAGKFSDSIVAMTSAETYFQLDDYWLSRIESVLREHGPLVVLLDSYSAATRSLGVDENKPEAAVPLMKLHNLVAQYDSTLIVIHHANKSGGEGSAARASRGSSAISAAADNLIEMCRFTGEEESGVKKYELRVEGRAETDGTPLVGFSKQSNEWTSYGSVGEAREEMRKDAGYDALSAAQLMVVDVLVKATVERNEAMSVAQLAAAIHETPTKAQKVGMNKTVKRLVELGLATQEMGKNPVPHYKEFAYRATGWAVSKHQVTF